MSHYPKTALPLISDKTTRNREINSLIKVAKETGCNNLMILTWDFEGDETIKGKDIVFFTNLEVAAPRTLNSWHMQLIEQVTFV